MPILDKDGAINWNGGSYDAIALIDKIKENFMEEDDDPHASAAISTVCTSTSFHEGSHEQAIQEEVEIAHQLIVMRLHLCHCLCPDI